MTISPHSQRLEALLRNLTGQSIDQIVGKGGVVVGTAVTAQSVTEIGGAVGVVLGLVIAVLSIWLLVWRLRLNALDRTQRQMENEMLRRERDRDRDTEE